MDATVVCKSLGYAAALVAMGGAAMVLVQGRCVYMYVWYSMWHTCTCMECAVSGLGECIVLDAYLQ